MSLAAPHGLAFQIGARTLFRVRRRLVRVGLGLDAVLAGGAPALPPLEAGADGYLITSLPEAALPGLGGRGLIAFVRHRYTRYHADLTIGFDAWWAGLSGNTRSSLKRKAKRLGTLDVRRYRTADELAAFHPLARAVAAKTYQERLLGAALPDTPAFVEEMLRAGAADAARAWLLFIDGAPVAYLYCPIERGVALYAFVGHDPAHAELSPGTLLHLEAMRDLFAAPAVRLFDFTEGEGQHKRAFATGGTACVDLLLLRRTLANRAVLAGLKGFDAGVALAKRLVARAGLEGWAKRVRRG